MRTRGPPLRWLKKLAGHPAALGTKVFQAQLRLLRDVLSEELAEVSTIAFL